MKIKPINTLITFTKKKPEEIKEKGSQPTFQGFPPHRICHIPTGIELGPRTKKVVPEQPKKEILYRHVDMLGNVIDITA